MPEKGENGQEPELEQELEQEQETEGGENGADGDGEDFDKERALSTIRVQREAEAKLKSELKAARADLKKFQDAEAKRKEAELSELEKAQKRITDLEAQLTQAQETTQALRLKAAFGAAVAKAGLKFASVTAENDAFMVADLEGVEIDESGKVTGFENVIKALQKERGYLFAENGADGDDLGTPPRDKKKGKLNKEALTDKPLVRF